jgi:hypothetical protein
MSPLKLWLIIPLAITAPALAQSTMQKGATPRSQGAIVRSHTPVATQPSRDPFHNPIGQGVPQAVSADSDRNGNRTNAPR